ncbi:MAG TPA: YpiB family protein [Pseudogracilibacillus sp.]|nr:YpiB family protein [Pseudogracilibacillus sp.]
MQVPVSIQTKKLFLQWFISHYKMKNEEIIWLFEDLLENERALFYLHFVQDITYCPKGIIISTQALNNLSFLFFKGHVQTNDVYTAYHELHLYDEEACYIQINLPIHEQNYLFEAVLEEEFLFRENDKITAEHLLNHLEGEGEKRLFKQEINKALDELDYNRFLYYSNRLKDLND